MKKSSNLFNAEKLYSQRKAKEKQYKEDISNYSEDSSINGNQGPSNEFLNENNTLLKIYAIFESIFSSLIFIFR